MKTLIVFLLMTGSLYAQSLPGVACNALNRERAKYPASLASVCTNAGDSRCPLGDMLNKAAAEAGLGMASKDFGYWVISPAGKVAADILMRTDSIGWDVFGDAENTARVNCGNSIGKVNRPYVSPVVAPPNPGTCEEQLKQLQYKIDNAKCVLVWP